MSYRNDVAEAKRLRKRSEDDQWRLAELTWTTVEAGTSRRQWATDVGFSESHARRLHSVWGAWGASPSTDRPTFTDAYARVMGHDSKQSQRVDTALQHATPAAIAKAVASSPDFQRAIARNEGALEGVEDQAITVRAQAPDDPSKKVRHAVSKALDVDETVAYLRGAASELGNAILAAESYGVTDTDGEAEALRYIKRLLSVYEGRATWTEADEELLAAIGSRLPGGER